MMTVRLEPSAPGSRVKHSITEPLSSIVYLASQWAVCNSFLNRITLLISYVDHIQKVEDKCVLKTIADMTKLT